jgi:hypothetical protein
LSAAGRPVGYYPLEAAPKIRLRSAVSARGGLGGGLLAALGHPLGTGQAYLAARYGDPGGVEYQCRRDASNIKALWKLAGSKMLATPKLTPESARCGVSSAPPRRGCLQSAG